MDTLRLAIGYIHFLQEIVQNHNNEDSGWNDEFSHAASSGDEQTLGTNEDDDSMGSSLTIHGNRGGISVRYMHPGLRFARSPASDELKGRSHYNGVQTSHSKKIILNLPKQGQYFV